MQHPATATVPATAHFAKQCGGKKPHFTFEDALKDSTALFDRCREITYPYRCDYCKYWHTGHSSVENAERARLRLEIQSREAEQQRRRALSLPLFGKITTKHEREAADRIASKENKKRQYRNAVLCLPAQLKRIVKQKERELL